MAVVAFKHPVSLGFYTLVRTCQNPPFRLKVKLGLLDVFFVTHHRTFLTQLPFHSCPSHRETAPTAPAHWDLQWCKTKLELPDPLKLHKNRRIQSKLASIQHRLCSPYLNVSYINKGALPTAQLKTGYTPLTTTSLILGSLSPCLILSTTYGPCLNPSSLLTVSREKTSGYLSHSQQCSSEALAHQIFGETVTNVRIYISFASYSSTKGTLLLPSHACKCSSHLSSIRLPYCFPFCLVSRNWQITPFSPSSPSSPGLLAYPGRPAFLLRSHFPLWDSSFWPFWQLSLYVLIALEHRCSLSAFCTGDHSWDSL